MLAGRIQATCAEPPQGTMRLFQDLSAQGSISRSDDAQRPFENLLRKSSSFPCLNRDIAGGNHNQPTFSPDMAVGEDTWAAITCSQKLGAKSSALHSYRAAGLLHAGLAPNGWRSTASRSLLTTMRQQELARVSQKLFTNAIRTCLLRL